MKEILVSIGSEINIQGSRFKIESCENRKVKLSKGFETLYISEESLLSRHKYKIDHKGINKRKYISYSDEELSEFLKVCRSFLKFEDSLFVKEKMIEIEKEISKRR